MAVISKYWTVGKSEGMLASCRRMGSLVSMNTSVLRDRPNTVIHRFECNENESISRNKLLPGSIGRSRNAMGFIVVKSVTSQQVVEYEIK